MSGSKSFQIKDEPDIIDVDGLTLDIEYMWTNKTVFNLDDDGLNATSSRPSSSSTPAPPRMCDKRGDTNRFKQFMDSPHIRSKRTAHTAQLENPPSKIPATQARVQARWNPPARVDLKRKADRIKEGSPEVIDLCDSDEDGDVPQVKRQRLRFPQIPAQHQLEPMHAGTSGATVDDEDEDYSLYISALNISDESNWIPLNPRPNHGPFGPNTSAPPSPEKSPKRRRGRYVGNAPRWPEDMSFNWSRCQGKVWNMLNSSIGERKPQSRKPLKFGDATPGSVASRRMGKLYTDVAYDKYALVTRFHRASGAVNKVAQARGAVVVCSSALGGNADNLDEDGVNPYNQSGSLVFWRDKRERILDAHCTSRPSNGNTVKKYYTVNDVTFDPRCHTRFLSAGNDETVRLWEYADVEEDADPPNSVLGVRLLNTVKECGVPHDIVYKSDGALLAVTSQNGKISIYEPFSAATRMRSSLLSVTPNKTQGHATGAVVWGRDQTDNLLFASTEPHDDSVWTGYHKVFDVVRERELLDLNTDEAGDAMAVDPQGRNLALFTRGKPGSHTLRLYDVRQRTRRPYSQMELESFNTPGRHDEVTNTSYSPDGIYLAVARSDNAVHVYDSRFVTRGPLYRFAHQDPNRGVPGSESFGVVKAQWIEGRNRRLGLVSGGNDGCVRMWDVGVASNDRMNGRKIAETSFDVASFSLGNVFNGEKGLIVGDSGGGVYIYDLVTG